MTDLITKISKEILSLRNKHTSFDRICNSIWCTGINATRYGRDYIISYDELGLINHFNPNPSYPKDFRSYF